MGDKVRDATQALVDALDMTTWSSWQTTAGFSEQCGALRAALASPPQEQAPGWISVDERLPESDDRVIVLIHPYGKVENEPCAVDAFFQNGEFLSFDEGDEVYPPLAWLPFPPLLAAPSQEQAKGRV